MQRVGDWGKPLTNYVSRELSWLAFNNRVLSLASSDDVPLLERVRFLSIFSTNLDEFFQVRVAGLAERVAAGLTELSFDGHTPPGHLAEVRRVSAILCRKQQSLFKNHIKPDLELEGIFLLSWQDLDNTERASLKEHFESQVFPVLTPLAVDPGHPFPFISDLSLNLAVLMRDPRNGEFRFARVKVPNTLERWVAIGALDAPVVRLLALEDLIAAHLDRLFPGMEVLEHHAFRVTRNADLTLNDEGAEDLLTAVEMELRRRRFQGVVRLEVTDTISTEVLKLLLRELDLHPDEVFRSSGPVDLGGLSEIADLPRSELRWPRWRGIREPELAYGDLPNNLFRVLRQGDVLVHHPYSSFSRSVGELVHQAAADPHVLAIKLTLYRTAGDSPIVDALVSACEQGKQVAVLIELKARFDEAANISWAKRLEQAGAHVAYGIVGLKIHAKTAMIVRSEPDGIQRYCHIGTGNYNHRTARLYEDFGLLTADDEVGADLATFFNQLTGYGYDVSYTRLITAPDQFRLRLSHLIQQEMEADHRRHIIIKVNGLADETVINQLYAASQAGVEIDLVVRGICCLRPGVPGLSERIRVRSVLGRFLEHSRIYHFANGAGSGVPATYIGSADLLPRNLDRRVEALVRVEDERIVERLVQVAEVCLDDECLAWDLDGDGVWTRHQRNMEADTHRSLQELARARAGRVERVRNLI